MKATARLLLEWEYEVEIADVPQGNAYGQHLVRDAAMALIDGLYAPAPSVRLDRPLRFSAGTLRHATVSVASETSTHTERISP